MTGAGFTEFIKEGIERVNDLSKLSDRTGISTERMGGLMQLTGGNAEALQKSLFHLSSKLGEVSQGSKTAAREFAAMGLDGAKLASMGGDKALDAIAERIRSLPTSQERARVGMQLFSKNAAELLPILSKGAAGMAAAEAAAVKMGTSFSRVDGAQVQLARRALAQTGLAIQGLQTQLTVQLAPYIKAAADWFNNLGLSGINMGQRVFGAIESVVKAIAFIADAVEALKFGWDVMGTAVKKWDQLAISAPLPKFLTGSLTFPIPSAAASSLSGRMRCTRKRGL